MESVITILSEIDLLTILKISEVIDGIHHIKSLLMEDESVEAFWDYFSKIRLTRFPLSQWNINAYGVYHLAERTNNCLERYNRRIGDFFLNTHPNLTAFISVIKVEFNFYSEKYKEARRNPSGIA
ncbi:hypothetical protein HZS_7338 [Henneguya salminicola]|nr:hypothetical protein HZS_7338 [Henneguya salminicola]